MRAPAVIACMPMDIQDILKNLTVTEFHSLVPSGLETLCMLALLASINKDNASKELWGNQKVCAYHYHYYTITISYYHYRRDAGDRRRDAAQ